MKRQLWMVGRMHEGKRQYRERVFKTREEAEQYIKDNNLGSNSFAFQVEGERSHISTPPEKLQ